MPKLQRASQIPPDPRDRATSLLVVCLLIPIGVIVVVAFWKTYLLIAAGFALVLGSAVLLRAILSR